MNIADQDELRTLDKAQQKINADYAKHSRATGKKIEKLNRELSAALKGVMSALAAIERRREVIRKRAALERRNTK